MHTLCDHSSVYLKNIHNKNLSRISLRHSFNSYKGIEGLMYEVLCKLNIKIHFTHAFYRLAFKPKPSDIVKRILFLSLIIQKYFIN